MAKKFDVKALRQKVLDTDDVIYDSVYVDAWDVELPVKTLTVPAIKEIMKQKEDEVRMLVLAVLNGCVTKEGERVFEKEDLAKFEGEKSFAPIVQLGSKILEISGLNQTQAAKQAKNN